MIALTSPARRRGFTLVELMVAVLIVGVLAAVAYPSFLGQMRKGRRADAVAALGALQLAQERYRSGQALYADSVATLGRSASSEGGHYDLSITQSSASGYRVVASAKASSSQAQDTGCVSLGIEVLNGTTTYLAGASAAGLAVDSNRVCWPR